MIKKQIILLAITFMAIAATALAQNNTIAIEDFNSVVVSPHIAVTFKKGPKASVYVTSITEPMEKLNIELKKNKLSIFLEDARLITKSEKENSAYNYKKPIYIGTVAQLVVTYTDLEEIELRGEEKFLFEDELSTDRLRVRVFGASDVTMNKVSLSSLQATLYGESHIQILEGTVGKQKITAYGETTVDSQNVKSDETKLTAYGSGTFQLNVANKLKVTSYGEATIVYTGNPEVNKGIVIGETNIIKKTAGN